MNLKDYLSITPEIQEALAAGKPVVALESTILSHGIHFYFFGVFYKLTYYYRMFL